MDPNVSEAYHWLIRSECRKKILLSIQQPMTATQLSHKVDLSFDSCRHALRELRQNGIVFCLNADARRGRLQWLSHAGKVCQRQLAQKLSSSHQGHRFPQIDWTLYGWATAFRHRAAVLKTLIYPMQAVVLRRRACFNDPSLKMSVSNVHDILRLFLKKGIVERVWIRKQPYPCYELTEMGKQMREVFLYTTV